MLRSLGDPRLDRCAPSTDYSREFGPQAGEPRKRRGPVTPTGVPRYAGRASQLPRRVGHFLLPLRVRDDPSAWIRPHRERRYRRLLDLPT